MIWRPLVVSVLLVTLFPVNAQDLEQVFGFQTESAPAAVETQGLAAALGKLIRKPDPEQSLLMRQVESGEWQKALLQYAPAFEGKAFQKTANGRALFALLHIQAGLPLTGVEKLALVEAPGQIHAEIVKTIQAALPENHWAWDLAEIQVGPGLRKVFPAAAQVDALQSRARGDWQKVIRLAGDNKIEEAAKSLAQLMKTPRPPVSQALMDITAARFLFQRGHFSPAIKYYEKVKRDSEYWTDAQEEMAWAFVRKGESENALGVSRSLVIPGVREQARAEAFFVHALAQLKVCDYTGVLKTLEEFPKVFKARSEALKNISTTSESPEIKKAVEKLMAGALSRADVGAEGSKLPRLVTRDQRLMDFARAGRHLTEEAKAADALYAKSLGQTGLQGYFDRLKQSSARKAQKAVSAIQSRIKELAAHENTEIKSVLRKLHIIEAEVIQQISVADRVTEKTRAPVVEKKGATGAKVGDTVQFPAEDEIWFDEIGSYRVNIKKACHARPKGKST